MMRRLTGLGFTLPGTRCLEIGTGHLPVAPVAFWLLGAAEVVTVDLHRRLNAALTGAMLRRLATDDRLAPLYDGLILDDRLKELRGLLGRPVPEILRRLGIRYHAPGDASRMPDADGSFDLSFSMTVLEHVTPDALRGLLAEARRLLGPDGFAAHLIDPSDHFAHQDPAITRINFLRFSPREWRRLGGNEFSYCNRLRASQLEQAFTDAGFHIERCERTVDEPSRAALEAGFPLHAGFRGFAPADLCTTELEVYARPASAAGALPGSPPGSAAGAPPVGAHGQRHGGGENGRAREQHAP
jgi:SAM-dependent methyltransferase